MKTVLIGDVIRSRKDFDPDAWAHFHQSIERVNGEFQEAMTIPLTVYSGDSFGGICRDVVAAVRIILALQEYQEHQESRVVIIEDDVTFGMERKNFLTLEGPALWRSGDLLKTLKKKKTFVLAALRNETQSLVVNTILNLVLHIRQDWNETEWAVYDLLETKMKQIDIAEDLGVSQQYISKIVLNSKMNLVKESERNLIGILHGITNDIH